MKYKGYVITPAFVHGWWQWYHEDYDGAPDSGDGRCGTAETIKTAKEQIDDQIDA